MGTFCSQKEEKNYNEINNRNCLISFIVLSKYKYPKFDIYEKLEKKCGLQEKSDNDMQKKCLVIFCEGSLNCYATCIK